MVCVINHSFAWAKHKQSSVAAGLCLEYTSSLWIVSSGQSSWQRLKFHPPPSHLGFGHSGAFGVKSSERHRVGKGRKSTCRYDRTYPTNACRPITTLCWSELLELLNFRPRRLPALEECDTAEMEEKQTADLLFKRRGHRWLVCVFLAESGQCFI